MTWRSLTSVSWQHSLVLALLMGLTADLPLRSVTSADLTIPNPETAAQQGDRLSPEELTQLEIGPELRDRLRQDPEWQPILAAVRQDIMILKWGDRKVTNPVWKRYGAKVYPLLAYYVRYGDEERQTYGMVGIRQLGKPYTTLWLTDQIKRRETDPWFSLLTSDPASMLDPSVWNERYSSKAWEKEFGLDDPQVRQRLIRLAKQNLEPPTSVRYYDQFNASFLTELLGYQAVYPYQPAPPKVVPNLKPWMQWEPLKQLTPQQREAAIAYYRSLPPKTQEYLLVDRLGQFKAGQVPAAGRVLLQALAADPQSPDRVWAIAELDRHGDAQASAQLQAILNGDLSQLTALTRFATYDDDTRRGLHAYYLLVNMSQKYPQSKFIQACREYGILTGRTYFGGEERGTAPPQQTPEQTLQAWQRWISRYPDHPGADDASYFLARSLQNVNDPVAAFRLWVKMMVQPMGDRDALYLAWPHVRTLLDLGLSPEQLQTLIVDPEMGAVVPLLKYALAVRWARSQDYTQALQVSQDLELTRLSPQILDSYYRSSFWAWWLADPSQRPPIEAEMQTMLTEQRQRWQQLQQLQQSNTPESQYRLATHWATPGGWKNGYLSLWEGWRVSRIPTSECQEWWVCNLKLRGQDTVRQAYQEASPNAVALRLYQEVLQDSRTPSYLREKTLYMVAMTLLWQWENFPVDDTIRIHPPAGVRTNSATFYPEFERDYTVGDKLERQVQQDYQRRIDQIVAELQVKFPSSPYIDDLLFSSYYLSGQRQYLQQLIERYPQGDRVTEARFLLSLKPANDRDR